MKYEIVWKPRKGGKTTFRQTVEAENLGRAALDIINKNGGKVDIISITQRQTSIETLLIECVMSEVEKQAVAEGWR